MKITLLAFILLTSCSKKIAVTEHESMIPDTTKSHVTLKVEQILVGENYKVEYPKDILDLYNRWFNEINDQYVVSPQIAFEKLQDHYTGEYSFLRSELSSEAGKDNFYILYAYFLKQINGDTTFSKERSNVLEIFTLLNKLNGILQYGGTFFGHQQSRIYGYTEYALYNYGDNTWLVKEYSIDKQKKLFLDGLRQRILDEEKHDFETLGEAKIRRRNELFRILDEMDKLITNFFYLRVAQEFQYTNYI